MTLPTQKIFMLAGEPSGDALGGALMAALRQKSNIEFTGIGGDCMIREGMESLIPMEETCVMGIAEVITHLPRLLKLIQAVVEEIETIQPDMLITIDLPDFNFQVAKRLKKRGIFTGKIVHYVAPSVWAWRPGRALKISKFLDGLLCLFPFEPAYFTPHGLRAEYVGHTLIEQKRKSDADLDPQNESFRAQYGIPDDDLILSVYLGSRPSEIKRHHAVFCEVANFMAEQYPNIKIVIPTLPSIEYQASRAVSAINANKIIITDPAQKWDVMRNTDIALAVSGTVGLELSYMNVPHVIAYKTSLLTWIIASIMVKVKYAHLTNILLNKPAIPEFLQTLCKPMVISTGLLRLLKDKSEVAKQRVAFHDVRKILHGDLKAQPSEQAADYVLQMLDDE